MHRCGDRHSFMSWVELTSRDSRTADEAVVGCSLVSRDSERHCMIQLFAHMCESTLFRVVCSLVVCCLLGFRVASLRWPPALPPSPHTRRPLLLVASRRVAQRQSSTTRTPLLTRIHSAHTAHSAGEQLTTRLQQTDSTTTVAHSPSVAHSQHSRRSHNSHSHGHV